MNSLVKKFLGFSIGPVGAAFISLITIPILTFNLSPEEFGRGSMFAVYTSIVLSVMYFGFDQAFTREYHEVKHKDNLLFNALIVPMGLTLILSSIILLNLKKITMYVFESSEHSNIVVMFILLINLMIIERFLLLILRMEEKALIYSFATIMSKLFILLFTISYLHYVDNNYTAMIYPVVFGQILITFLLFFLKRSFFKEIFNFKVDFKLIKKMFYFGFPLIISTGIFTLLTSMDRILLQRLSDFHEVGIYVSALKIASVLSIIQISFSNFWVPTAYRWHSQGKTIKHYEYISNLILLLMSVVFYFIVVFKGNIVIILSPDYSEAQFIVALLCLQPIMYTISETTTLGIVFSRKSKVNILISLISLVVNLILGIALIPIFGAIGAAIGTAFSFLTFFIARTYFSKKYWIGFPATIHFLVSFYLVFVAITSSFSEMNIVFHLINIFVIFVLQYRTVVQTVLLITSKSEKEKWEFI